MHHVRTRTNGQVVDYSSDPHAEDSNLVADFTGDRLKEWLETDGQERPVNEDGKPIGVRWSMFAASHGRRPAYAAVHVNGLNWEVIKTLTLQYGYVPCSRSVPIYL